MALLDADDAQHPAAREAVRGKSPLRVTPATLAETTTALRRRALRQRLDGNTVARAGLAALRLLPGYEPVTRFNDPEVARIYAASGSISYADACCIFAAIDQGEELLTLDEAQLAAWRRQRKAR